MIPSLLHSAGGEVLRMMKAKMTTSRLSLVLVLLLSVLIVGPQLCEANLKVIITIDGGWRYSKLYHVILTYISVMSHVIITLGKLYGMALYNI